MCTCFHLSIKNKSLQKIWLETKSRNNIFLGYSKSCTQLLESLNIAVYKYTIIIQFQGKISKQFEEINCFIKYKFVKILCSIVVFS